MARPVIVSAVRTPIGSFAGTLSNIPAIELGALTITEAIRRAHIEKKQIDELILGNVLQAGLGQNPARQAAIKAGIPHEVPSYTVNKVCGSGLKSVALAAQAIIADDAEFIIAGGMENMSASPYLMDQARFGYRMGNGKIIDSMIKDGLFCAFNNYHMGITAENIAKKYNISREEQDKLALHSQQKAIKAIENGVFEEEIIPVSILTKKGEIIFDTDEYPRKDITYHNLSRLRPAFDKTGTVTAGNASGINDGAAMLVVMSEEKAKNLDLKPLARIVSYGLGGVDPALMGMGPVTATKKALEKAGMSIKDIDLIEANEAFASQFLAVGKELHFNHNVVNINGGAIALGHPIGASGARILVTLLYSLKARQAKLGLATLCIGGGQGIAMIVERV